MFYKQLSDARDTYRKFLRALDDAAKLDNKKKIKMQTDAQKVNLNQYYNPCICMVHYLQKYSSTGVLSHLVLGNGENT